MLKIFRLYPIRFCLITLAFIVSLSYGQATKFALWQDDNALIFKLQHLEEQAGFFGAGPLGLGAYRYIAVPFIPIYKLFGLNIPIFYVWAITFYFLATVSVAFLARQFTKNNLLALLSGSIFAAGFVGSDGILRLFNSIQTSYSVIFVALLFVVLHRFAQSRRSYYYLLSLLLFFFAVETAFIRTQYLIFPVIIFGLLFFGRRRFLLISPFLAIFYLIFSQNADPRSNLLKEFINGILGGQLQYLHGFFGNIGNIIVPLPINNFLFHLAGKISLDYDNRLLILELVFLSLSIIFVHYISKKANFARLLFSFCSAIIIAWFALHIILFHNQELIFRHSVEEDTAGIFANFIGGLFLILASALWLLVKSKKTRLILIFTLSWMLSNILAYSVYLPFSPLPSIHRYLVHTFVAYAILIPILIYHLWGRRVAIIIPGFIIFSNIWFSINYQHKFIVGKSIPTNKFYEDLKRFVPNIPEGASLYFDIADDEISQQQFRDFFSVASMPDATAIAIRYGIDRYDFKMTQGFDEFISSIDDKSLDTAFSFFHSSDGLKNTTDITRSNLARGKKFSFNEIGDLEKVDSSLVTPAFLEFNARVVPNITIKQNCVWASSNPDKKKFFDYILSRDNFRKEVKVATSSEEKYQKSSFLTDGSPGTLWRGNRGWWHNNEHEEITLDLGEIKIVGQLVWVNGYANSTPIDYNIETSIDGKSWQVAQKVNRGAKKNNGLRVIENFKPRETRFARMIISSTFDKDSPAIEEIELVEENFVGIDKNRTEKLERKAICVRDKEDLGDLNEFIRKRGIEATISWKTDKSSDNVVRLNIMADNLYHSYKVFLPAGGTRLSDLRIESGLLPAEIYVTNIKVIYPKKDQLINLLDLHN